uniref:Uncharacterized protein n=1 Tax=Candidatus Kentrum sp. MB TaxID=2138164 RepID=A0A450XTX2_9GAMM|nr:MAG: hypothetical protein BECKMB1821G_GA0114241_11245 [Candidatus Kentron sp. MB]VFK34591.1 MAG: hypothetical protein BECKMB1821I_GA0114274_10775 [Candidatus Kentron sp. MB]VFK76868.1 MAG: hypothetical protein BECKMB1821H_GA0114242_107919 [Candidatus Kentron sp. MB]
MMKSLIAALVLAVFSANVWALDIYIRDRELSFRANSESNIRADDIYHEYSCSPEQIRLTQDSIEFFWAEGERDGCSALDEKRPYKLESEMRGNFEIFASSNAYRLNQVEEFDSITLKRIGGGNPWVAYTKER